MSTRCTINFGYLGRVIAKVYQHSDGYPESENGILCKLQRFFRAVEADTNDCRFNDPSYLAAKFVVWATQADRAEQAQWRRESKLTQAGKDGPLNFLGYGVCMEDPGDIDYTYYVECGSVPALKYPAVKHGEASESCPILDWTKVNVSKPDAATRKAIKALDKNPGEQKELGES